MDYLPADMKFLVRHFGPVASKVHERWGYSPTLPPGLTAECQSALNTLIKNDYGGLECTRSCRSPIHAHLTTCAITKGSEEEVAAYLQWLCCNYTNLVDAFGRTLLHTMASCGKWRALRWTLQRNHMDVNIRDKESGWTPLHRSLFYGKLSTAKILLDAGANLAIVDFDLLTPLDIVMKDVQHRVPFQEALHEAYVWGNNRNYNLGFADGHERSCPELLDNFNHERLGVKQVEICDFHSVFLLVSGEVFTCGHGQGGRLGLNEEKVVLTPQPIKVLERKKCVMVAAAQDHTVFLTEGGSVWSNGINSHHQLGHVPPPEKLLIPKKIMMLPPGIVGICAARYHTVAFSHNSVYTFGLNAGQLGHHPAQSDKRQTEPRLVKTFPVLNPHFVVVTASQGSTICATRAGDVFVLHEYQCRKIASKQTNIATIRAVGGKLDKKADGIFEVDNESELKVFLLTNDGEIFVWFSETCPQFNLCIPLVGRHIIVSDIAVSNTGVILSSRDGEGFVGTVALQNLKSSKKEDIVGPPNSNRFTVSRLQTRNFGNCSDKKYWAQMRLQRLPHIHRAAKVSCNLKGNNFAILQANPKTDLYRLPELPASQINVHMGRLLSEAVVDDGIHDAVINVGGRQFAVHQFVLAMRCEYFRTQIITLKKDCNTIREDCLRLECPPNIHPDIMEQLLTYLYTDSCRLLISGQSLNLLASASFGGPPDVVASSLTSIGGRKLSRAAARRSPKAKSRKESKPDPKLKNPVKMLQEAAQTMGVMSLYKRLECVDYVDEEVVLLQQLPIGKLVFDRKRFARLSDVRIHTANGTEFACHKCILVAGSEYFYSMLVSGWLESSSSASLTLSIPSDILQVVIECLYTEDSNKLRSSTDMEFICNVLVTADQLLIARLKTLCEIVLADIINLKNVAELLEFSCIYNAPQLKLTCMEFIGLNLAALLQSKTLNVLGDETLVDLTNHYRNMIRQMGYRAMTPHESGPSREDMITISQMYPVDLNDSELRDDRLVNVKIQTKDERKTKKRTSKSSGFPTVVDGNTSFRRRHESSCSVASDTSERSNSTATTNATTEPIVCRTMEEISCPPSPASSISSSPITSPPSSASKWLQGSEDMVSAFPDLVVDLNSTLQQSRKAFGVMSRPSQKERKKMASLTADTALTRHAAPIPNPPAVFAEREAKLANPWGKCVSDIGFVSFSDIMKIAPEKEVPKYSRPLVLSNTSTVNSDNSSATQTRNPWENSKRTSTLEAGKTGNSNNGSEIDADVASKKDSRRKSNMASSFKDILKLEQDEIDTIARQHSKSLSMIQIEDQAIEELLNYYAAKNHPDEHITVSRIVPDYVLTPVWKVNKKLV